MAISMKKALKKLLECDLNGYKVEIKPLNPNWVEYNNLVVDYSEDMCAVTNRLIPPYCTTNNHGPDFYSGIVSLVKDFTPESIIDLGCGAGELLSKLDCKDKYGLTIHVGEVKYARDKFGLSKVIPADMRDIDKYFDFNSIDMIIAFWSFNYLRPNERLALTSKIYNILKPSGCFVHVDEYGHPLTELTRWDKRFTQVIVDYPVDGRLTVLQKNV